MAFTFATLKTELLARGFEDLDSTRQGYFINRAYQQLAEAYPWPFLRTTTTGTAPVTISDLRAIQYVVDSTNDFELSGVDERTVRDMDPDLAVTGTPELWWLSGSATLNVWPVNTTASLTVVYYKVPAELTGTDATLIPARYEYLIVDAAVILAYRNSDNLDAAIALQGDFDLNVQRMAETLLDRNFQNPDLIVSGGDGWYDG